MIISCSPKLKTQQRIKEQEGNVMYASLSRCEESVASQ